jgi:hypothetical protein
MPSSDTSQQLIACLQRLEDLNPDLTTTELRRIYALAESVGKEFFPVAAEQTERLIGLYRQSPVKQRGAEILAEYFQHLDACARQLCEAGEISPAQEGRKSFSTALVPLSERPALDWCKILNRAEPPKPLIKAADAFRRRHEVVASVVEIAFRVMWLVDRSQAVNWLIEYFKRQDGDHDPDVIRDALMVVLDDEELPPTFLSWVETWALDANLLEYWPTVTRLADRIICRYGMEAWNRQPNLPRLTPLAHLRLILRRKQQGDDSHLLHWLRNIMDELGNGVLRFMALEAALDDCQKQHWRKTILLAELKRMAAYYTPIMLAANCILEQPDGAQQLALAFMGLYGRSRQQWDEAMIAMATKIIRRTFMRDLKESRTPVETIRTLTFGDQAAFNFACAELDLASEKFDSIAQREKVTIYLSTFYASYRQTQLIGAEVAKRYRRLMRILHEDFLRQVLEPEQLEELRRDGAIDQLANMAAQARKFLARRRDIENSLEEMLAAEMDFERYVRQQRIQVFRRLAMQ